MSEKVGIPQNQLSAEEKFKAHFERARKGVLKFLNDHGGTLPMDQMHDYSLNKFFIQHQRFSELMEGLVSDQYVEFDWSTMSATITPKGKEFIVG